MKIKYLPFVILVFIIFQACQSNNVIQNIPEYVQTIDEHAQAFEFCQEIQNQFTKDEQVISACRENISILRKYDIFESYGCYHYLSRWIEPVPFEIIIDYYSLADILDNSYTYISDDEINNNPKYQEAVAGFENTKEGYENYKMPEVLDWDIFEYSPFKPYMARVAVQKQWPYMIIRLAEDDYKDLAYDEMITLLSSIPASMFYNYLETSKDKHDIFLMTSVFPTVLKDPVIAELARTLSPLKKYLKDDSLTLERIKKYRSIPDSKDYSEYFNDSLKAFETGQTQAALLLMRLYFDQYYRDLNIDVEDILNRDDEDNDDESVYEDVEEEDVEEDVWRDQFSSRRIIQDNLRQNMDGRFMPRYYGKYNVQPIAPYIGKYIQPTWYLPIPEIIKKNIKCKNNKACENSIHNEVLEILRPQKTTLTTQYNPSHSRQFVHDANYLGTDNVNIYRKRIFAENEPKQPISINRELIDDRCYLNNIKDSEQYNTEVTEFIVLLNTLLEQGNNHEALVVAFESFINCSMPSTVSEYIKLIEPGNKISYINNNDILLNVAPVSLLDGQYIAFRDIWQRLDLVQMAADGRFDYSAATRSERALIAEIAMIYGNYTYAEELTRDLPMFSGEHPHYYTFKRVRGLALVGLRRFDEAFETLRQRSFVYFSGGDPCVHKPVDDDYEYHWRIVMLETYEITGQTPLTLLQHPDPELAEFYTKINDFRRSLNPEVSIFLLEEAIILARARGDETAYQSLINQYRELGFDKKSDFLTKNID